MRWDASGFGKVRVVSASTRRPDQVPAVAADAEVAGFATILRQRH